MARRSGIAALWGVTMAAVLALGAAAVQAAGGGGGGNGVVRVDQDALHSQPDYMAGLAAIKEQRWADAINALDRHVGRNYRDADAQNWLAYSNRKAGRLDEAFKHYKLALTFNPRHLGAHEYIGEAYLMTGQIDEARRHLEQLATLCDRQCEQYRDLADAIEHKRVSSAR